MATALILIFVIAASFYINFLPSIVAFRRGHDSRIAILLVNVFLGWTGVAWIIALVWALSGRKGAAEKTVIINNHVFVQGHQSTVEAVIPHRPEPALQVPAHRAYMPVPTTAPAFGRRVS